MSKDVQISDRIEEINSFTYHFCKKVLKMNSERALKLLTFLLNNIILFNLFPSILREKHISGIFRGEKKFIQEQNFYKIDPYIEKLERIIGLILFLLLKYKSNFELTKGKTDSTLNSIFINQDQHEMIENFFLFNSFSPDLNIEFIKKNKLKVDYLPLPELLFDPDYMKMKEHRAFQHLNVFMYFTVIYSKETLSGFDYHPVKELREEYFEIFDNENPITLLNLDPKLKIAPQITNLTLNFGIPIFGSKLFLEDIFSCFKSYYCKKIPSKREEINLTLDCYLGLMKMSKGKSLFSVPWIKVVSSLTDTTSKEFALQFLSKFCHKKNYEPFSINFNPNAIIDEYNSFLKNGAYTHFGKLISGTFWIWRSLLKYFEDLQSEKEFKSVKGKYLETWAFKMTEDHQLDPEKIILINKEKNPWELNYYRQLQETISSFPKKPISLNVDFPEPFKNWYFVEIDFAFRIEDYLFMIECKGTSVLRSEEPNVIWWAKNYLKVVNRLKIKEEIIRYNLSNGNIQHPFLNGIEHFVPLELNTEGLTGYLGLLNIDNFLFFLGQISHAHENNKFQEFLEENIETLKDSRELKVKTFSMKDIIFKITMPIWKQLQEDPKLKEYLKNKKWWEEWKF